MRTAMFAAWLGLAPHVAGAQSSVSQSLATDLARIALLEDSRGTQGHDLSALTTYLTRPDATLRAAAVRALGRQQSERWLPAIYPLLRDASPAVRMEAMNAVGQALQGRRGPSASLARPNLLAAVDSLARAAGPRASDAEAGVAARTIGRLPYGDSALARRGEAAIVVIASPRGEGRRAPARLEGSLHGLYTLARQARTTGAPGAAAVEVMRRGLRLDAGGFAEAPARVRRLAMLGLTTARVANAADVQQAQKDRDEQVRRLAQLALPLLDAATRRPTLALGLRDASPMVRVEAVRAARTLAGTEGCGVITTAIGDDNAHVMLAAIDGLSSTCVDRDRVVGVLLGLIDTHRSDSPSRSSGRPGWHVHAHALMALARTAPDRALPIVRRDAAAPAPWPLRTWIARAATVLRDTATLRALAADRNGNVKQAALGGLAATTGHADDARFIEALSAPENHVVMDAAAHLKGSPGRDAAVAALLAALDRITAERRENSHDARVAILDRLDELGSSALVPRIEPLRSDFDSTVARKAAAVLSHWSGRPVTAAPSPLPLPREDIATLLRDRWRARITMAAATGGGTFEIELFGREAPYTVARFIRLARAGYYNGLTFHRVEPGFVIQGGSPAANEYVGDAAYLRDELGLRSLTRGTLGISTRGRDTGDAQIYVNLTDNFRLDHDYTPFAAITRGREVAEGVLEADVIERIEIVRVPR
ncbi:MAG: peptidylprolyl isomerase [Gemmatimonadaceae bacterium]|nr:peptidylprolyl isomerase [Gemmatimonadaceae bacterium]